MSGFTCQNCGGCCGPVGVNTDEWRLIRRQVRRLGVDYVARLRAQEKVITCIFRDMEADKCAIYEARPQICRMQGYFEGLPCSKQPQFATKNREEGRRILLSTGAEFLGVLGFTLGWDDVLRGLPEWENRA